MSELKSGVILDMCKDPKFFFEKIRDDMYFIIDSYIQEVDSTLNGCIRIDMENYFKERFGIWLYKPKKT